MKRLLMVLLALSPSVAMADSGAHDYPTVERVNYVLECMAPHNDKVAYLYKCSCQIDAIARQLPFDDYDEMSTAMKAHGMAGENGDELRDPPDVKAMVVRFKKVLANAEQACEAN